MSKVAKSTLMDPPPIPIVLDFDHKVKELENFNPSDVLKSTDFVDSIN
jgi:hypothetical protein